MRQIGFGKFRFAILFSSFRIKFTSWADMHILQLGFIHIGKSRK